MQIDPMNSNSKNAPALSTQDLLIQAANRMNTDEYLELLHTTYDPVYSLLLNYQCAVMVIETKFNVLNNRLSLQAEHNPIESIKSRVKSLESIIRKLENRNLPLTLESVEENLQDVAGLRVICSFVDDIYKIEECLLAQEDVTLINRKDYIKEPKPNGYRSLHLIIKTPIYTENGKKEMFVEIQLRTIAMDFWASLEHKLMYKKNINPEIAEKLAEELAECAQISKDLDLKMLRIRDRIVSE